MKQTGPKRVKANMIVYVSLEAEIIEENEAGWVVKLDPNSLRPHNTGRFFIGRESGTKLEEL